jgi:hypothetical protein
MMYSSNSFNNKPLQPEPSRFDLLCAALGRVHDQYSEYRQTCSLFVGMFRERLEQYLGAPAGTVALYPREGSFAGRKVDGPASAMNLANDTWWHFGVVIDVYASADSMPGHDVGFNMRLKKIGSQYHLQMEDQPAVVIEEGDDKHLERVFDQMFQFLKGRYETTFQEFLETGDPMRRFGF